jgi:dTDP-L-rhamnose 4-epimerase
MTYKILVIGGAGFIGSHLVDILVEKNHDVVVYDNLEQQVHGNLFEPPDYLPKQISFIKNDIRNKETLLESLKDIEVIYHLAAAVGIGQSMYQIEKYVEVNTLGTAKLLELLINEPNDIKKLIIASSNSTYGEGRYFCEKCNNKVNPKLRSIEQLNKGDWELNCPICSDKLQSIPTDEEKTQEGQSIYGLTKMDQEKMCLLIGETYGIDTTALRFFNVYGSRQSLSNPYTGVCAIFSTNLLSGNPPRIYEDGLQTRDFIHVSDTCQALILSLSHKSAKNEVFNVGTGIATSIKDVAEVLAQKINPSISPTIANNFRPGDIRHCFADISKIKNSLGFKPLISFRDGMKELIEWVKSQKNNVEDKTSIASNELEKKGLLK